NGYEIISDKVIGKNLFNFIYSKDVKQIYREIIACVKNGKTIKFPFRCDSPTHVRNFFMTINLDEEKKVTFTSEFLSENLRETPLKAIYSTNISEEYMLVMCSWCKKVKTQAGWLELEEVLNKEKIFIKREIPQISHGICEECYSVIKSEISKQE
ncbi:MAG: hypothetical protein N3G21_12235, partial [Candidatus Hydrogenedentes bacterium]|nr:hypothetical protein [Candidatus Hydrogenedentota bacterium]